MSDGSKPHLTELSLAQGARLLATLEAARTAAARATSEQLAASAAARREQGELEIAQESGQKLSARGRDIRNTLQLLREAVERAKLTALNAGLEGARMGDSVGKALVVMGDEVRNLLARAVDALEEHAGLLAEVDRDRDRCLAEVAHLSNGARDVGAALARAEAHSQLSTALLGELRTDLHELFGADLQSARALAETAAHVKTLANSVQELKQRSSASDDALRELLSPLLALLPPPREDAPR
jgi:methyl-accepting chemotaxis protein